RRWMARRLKETVNWVEDRSEHMQASSHARDQKITFSAAVRSDGRVLGLRARILTSVGAYGARPYGATLNAMTCAGLIPGPYDIRDYVYDSIAIATNCSPEGAYRGVGMVTAVLAHERLMDLIAVRLGEDPADVRRRNFVRPEQMPYTSVTGHPYESGDYGAALEMALHAFDYRRARAERARARAAGRLVGIGVSSYVEFTGAGSATFVGRGMAAISGVDTARVWLDKDGHVHMQTSCPNIGQGVQTTFAPLAADARVPGGDRSRKRCRQHRPLRDHGGLRRRDQPHDRQRPGGGRSGAGRRSGSARGDLVRRGRPAAQRQLHGLPDTDSGRCAIG